MIRVFSPTDTDFTSNGDVVIKAVSAYVHKVDNGDYYLELVCGIEYAKYLEAGNIIVVDTPQGNQGFRIGKDFVKSRTKITIKAWHLYYDSENYIIEDSYVVNKTCEEALEHLNNATDIESPFWVYSDLTTVNSFRCVRKSLREAFATVLERWGGHIVRSNFTVEINAATGKDNGVVIEYRKNLKDITVTENWAEVCTKCLPVGQDGILLPEIYLTSEVQYDIPYSKVVTFDQSNIVRDDYPTEAAYQAALIADLRAKATEYLTTAQYPQINYTVEANVDKISDTGDYVEVKDYRLGVSLGASVISFDYNALTGKYDKVEFGTLGNSLSGLMTSISSSVSATMGEMEQNWNAFLQAAVEVATSEIWQELGGGYCITSADQLMIVDTLPAEGATYCMKIDKNGISFSDHGIAGNFQTALSIGGTLDLGKLETINGSLASFTSDTLYIGGSTTADIKIYNNGGSQIGTIGRNGIILNNENVYSSIFYSSGGQETLSNIVCSGYIDTTGEKLVFSLPLPKSMKNVISSLSALKINARGINGAIFTISASGYDVLSDPDITLTKTQGDKSITITLEASSPLSSSADTPASVEVISCIIDFS